MRKAARKAAEAAARDRGLGQAMQLEVLGRKPRPPKRDESSYNKGSCDMRAVDTRDPVNIANMKPGDFFWLVEDPDPAAPGGYRSFCAKYPDGSFASIPVKPTPPGHVGPSWGWDGNLDKPTLTPSVHHVGHWHGWVRAGRMVSV
jgi:hypothetical protein